MKPGSNLVEDHPQLSHKGHPVDGALVGAGSQWPQNASILFWHRSTLPESSFIATFQRQGEPHWVRPKLGPRVTSVCLIKWWWHCLNQWGMSLTLSKISASIEDGTLYIRFLCSSQMKSQPYISKEKFSQFLTPGKDLKWGCSGNSGLAPPHGGPSFPEQPHCFTACKVQIFLDHFCLQIFGNMDFIVDPAHLKEIHGGLKYTA